MRARPLIRHSGATHRVKPGVHIPEAGVHGFRALCSAERRNEAVGMIGYGDAMNHDNYSDDYLRDILMGVKTIAVVGASPRAYRPSHGVMRYLQGQGYRAIPVNPFAAGSTIHGERCYAGLAEIAEKIDMVDVFR